MVTVVSVTSQLKPEAPAMHIGRVSINTGSSGWESFSQRSLDNDCSMLLKVRQHDLRLDFLLATNSTDRPTFHRRAAFSRCGGHRRRSDGNRYQLLARTRRCLRGLA